MFYSNLNHSTQ